jgi:UDP:flavonoid glycosyltransferase YjiC (YdhE family)
MTPLTAVILNWARPENVLRIVNAWQSGGQVAEAIVWNNCADRALTHDWARTINAGQDMGLYSRFAAACLARHDAVLIQDDDLELPAPSLAALIEAWRADPDIIHGVFGRAPKPDGSYARRINGDAEAPIILTRALIVHRRHLSRFFAVAPSFEAVQRHAKPSGNGEDILFSYVVRQASGRLHRTHAVAVNELPAPDPIHRRNGDAHQAHRTRMLRGCEDWLQRSALTSGARARRTRPATILIATELGSGYGHLKPLAAVAGRLAERGQACVIATHQPEAAEALGLHRYGPVLPAPVGFANAQRVRQQASYTSLLHDCGWHSVKALAGRLRAWRSLLQLSGARAVVVDHAPTALLAARSLGLPAAALGTGFSLPPLQDPFPAYPTILAREQRLRDNETNVLAVVNGALDALGAEHLPNLQTLFADVELGFKTYAELDHYGIARDVNYIGLPDFSTGLPVDWGAQREPRLCAYLRAGQGVDALLAALAATKAQVMVRLNDAPAASLARYERPGLRIIVNQDVWLRQAVETCDAFIGSGSHGAVAESLLAGKPCLIQHFQMEQRLLAERVAGFGAGLVMAPDQPDSFAPALQRLLDDTALHKRAQDFASRYAGRDRSRILPQWVDRWLQRTAINP